MKDILTVRDFCAKYGLSRTTFFNMLKEGTGPKHKKVRGKSKTTGKILISLEDAEAWFNDER